jgi:5-methylcytosine-specific restriction endonuclease McrA
VTIVDVPRVLDTRGTTYRRVLRADRCAYGDHAGGTVDHITPRSSLRQPEGARNLTGACEACNSDKGALSLLLYLLDRLDG